LLLFYDGCVCGSPVFVVAIVNMYVRALCLGSVCAKSRFRVRSAYVYSSGECECVYHCVFCVVLGVCCVRLVHEYVLHVGVGPPPPPPPPRPSLIASPSACF
jgi:hypothetical protein